MLKSILIISIMYFLTNAFAADCNIQFESKKHCAQLKFKKPVSRKYSVDFELQFFDLKSKKPMTPKDEVFVYLWMKMEKPGEPKMEHGSEPIILKKKSGKYLGSNVWFLMLGPWELHIQLRKDGKVKDKGMMLVDVKRGKNKK